MNKHHFGFRIFYVLIVAVLVTTLGNPYAALAQNTNRFSATQLSPDSTISTTKSGMVSVIVKFKGSALASYQGNIPGLAATSPSITKESQLNVKSQASQAYLNYLNQEHQTFIAAQAKSIPQAKITHDYTVVLNGLSVILPVDQLSTLENLPNVEGVYPDELLHPDTDNSPQFIGAPTIWTQLGGQESSGEGVIVGVIDTGIWPEHPSFSDPDPSGKAYAAPPPTLSGDPRECDFSSGTQPGDPFTCNNKLIGAYMEMATYYSLQPLLGSAYSSARDEDGHGTHTSSTAAGNAGVDASIFGVPRGTISGIAPRAHVIMYKVCGDQGCYSSDSAASVQQAILDGVNVINFSISGGSSPYSDTVEQAFFDAYSAGIFVAASAGNAGPSSDTTDHRGPWVTTVAASTQNRAFEDTITLTADGGDSLIMTGTSLTAGVGPAPLVVPASDTLCNSPFAAGSVAGDVVLCKRGTTGRAEKGYNVLQGGAVGMILYNQAANVTDLETDNHFLPASHIQYDQGQQILTFLGGNTNVQATLTEGARANSTGDVMASFSSRGGPGQPLGVSKPDITAPGVQILAGASPVHLTVPDGGVALGPEGEMFQAIAGTSMSSPHIAGSGALLKAEHPDWTPGQIKSALMTTATTQVVKEDGVTPATPFDDGSGRVDLNYAGDPGLTFDASPSDYSLHSADLWNANYPSVYVPALAGEITLQRTAHNLLSHSTSWDLSVTGATDFTVSVPASLTVPAGGNATFDITIDARDVPVGQTRTAMLSLMEDDTQGMRMLHMPITFNRKQASVTLAKTCAPAVIDIGQTTDCTVTFQNTALNVAYVNVMDQLPNQLALVNGSVVGGTVSASGDTLSWSGTLPAAQAPDVTIGTGSTPAGYLPLISFGITPITIGDESAVNFNVPAFTYAGDTYTRLAVVSNGYIVIGGATSADINYLNQSMPDATRPNNVIAPFWTDLNPSAGGAVRVGSLTDGSDSWLVIDYAAVKEYSTAKTDTFEVWIGVNGDAHPGEDISIAYGTVQGNGDNGLLTVGAENLFGNRGKNYYYNGTGTLPTNTTELVVTGTPAVPSPAHTITYSATGKTFGKWTNYAQMTSYQFQGTSLVGFEGEVMPILNFLPVVQKP
jgi:uncharacterized repeat protein (TIGR01451 family)